MTSGWEASSAVYAWRLAKEETNDPIKLRSERDEARDACKEYERMVINLSALLSREHDANRMTTSGKRSAEAAVDAIGKVLKRTTDRMSEIEKERDDARGQRDTAGNEIVRLTNERNAWMSWARNILAEDSIDAADARERIEVAVIVKKAREKK